MKSLRNILLIVILFGSLRSFAQNANIEKIITHNRVTVVTDPVKGVKDYAAWGVFPSSNKSIRQITMNVILGSPDTLPTAHWDYLDHITIRRKGGKAGKYLNYELGRMLTPYGSVFGKGWTWKWQVDVTDFAVYLRDSVEVLYAHSGYEPNTVGWALTIDFEIVYGPQIAKPLGMVALWNGHFRYGDLKEKPETTITPISYESSVKESISRIRIQHTGHGMDTPRGCSEFCSRWRAISIDGKEVDRRNMWKDCGANPLYPQGGTWIYDRAYWCPGDLQKPDIIDTKLSQGKHTVSMELEPYTATENIQAQEVISAYLFQYSTPLKKTDVRLEQIMVPTNEQQFSRLNPACFFPRIIIRNLGSDVLRSAIIIYGTEGFTKRTYYWSGNLKFNQTADIAMSGEIDFIKDKINKFTAQVTKPNGKNDEWKDDNTLTTSFTPPNELPQDFIITFMTNNKPKDNQIFIVNNTDTVYIKHSQKLEPKTLYQDTIHLNPGKYDICLTDSAGDGLEFWAEPQNGDGYLRLLDMKGNLIHSFESDCGNGQKLSFVATSAYITDTINGRYGFSLSPRLTDDKTVFGVVANKWGNMEVQITVDAKIIERHEYPHIKSGTFEYNLDRLPKGRIVLEAFMDGISRFKGRLNKK